MLTNKKLSNNEVEQQRSSPTKKFTNKEVHQQEVHQQEVHQQGSWATGSWAIVGELLVGELPVGELLCWWTSLLVNFLLVNFLLVNFLVGELPCCSTSCWWTSLLVNFLLVNIRLVNYILVNFLLVNIGEWPNTPDFLKSHNCKAELSSPGQIHLQIVKFVWKTSDILREHWKAWLIHMTQFLWLSISALKIWAVQSFTTHYFPQIINGVLPCLCQPYIINHRSCLGNSHRYPPQLPHPSTAKLTS